MATHQLAPTADIRAQDEVPSDLDSLIPTMQLLRELAALGPNWDSYDANPLTPQAVATASTLITAIDESRRCPTVEFKSNGWQRRAKSKC